MARLRFVVLLVCAAALLSATPKFVTGDLIWATYQDSRLFDISSGTTKQNLTGATPFHTFGTTQYGQIAFSADATTAYITLYGQNKVVSISNTGTVKDVATGIANPTGLIRTSSGRMLVSSYLSGKIYDITGGTGQDYSGATAWASGLSGPRSLIETPGGIYVAENFSDSITLVTTQGGDQTNTPTFAKISQPLAMAYYGGKIYATSAATMQVFDVSAGGAISMAESNAYARGQSFTSLAVGGNKLYAGTSGATAAGSGIWDISSPSVKNYSGTTYAVAYNLPLSGDSLLAVVPAAQIVQPPPAAAQTPEPGTIIVGIALLVGSYAVRQRLKTSAPDRTALLAERGHSLPVVI